ncbi:MAG: hypothetical protein ACKPKO_24640, partial [Candidatus Fonsibacter sp.]
MDKIREFAQKVYAPFFFKKGLVDPWAPSDRWECPPYSVVKDLPGSDVMVLLAKLVDQIELEGKSAKMWALEGQTNLYRERILDKVCTEIFGCNEPSDKDVKFDYQRTVVGIFRKLTVSRAKQAGSYRDVARDIAATHAAKMLPEVLSRVRVTSMGPWPRPRSPSRPRATLREVEGWCSSRYYAEVDPSTIG